MDGRKLKDHVIQLYQTIKQVFTDEERKYLYQSLKIYKSCHDGTQLALQLCRLCSSQDRIEIVRDVWKQIIHGQVAELDNIIREYPINSLDSGTLSAHISVPPVKFKTGKLFDEGNQRGSRHILKVHKTAKNNIGFCIRGGLEHGLGIYVSGIEEGSAADESGLHIGDKILEVNNISLHKLPSSSAVKVLTGSNQLKLLVERTGTIPEWRLSRERTVWLDCQTGKLDHGDYEEYGTDNYIRGIDVDIPERCVTWSTATDGENIGFNIRGGNEYRLGIYVSHVDPGSTAEEIGIHTGDQIIDVNGVIFDNISHAHAVETLKNSANIIMSLRDVGRFPAYKEIYAEYTWTGTSISDGNSSQLSGEKLIERKLPDTWIESGSHKKRKNLLLRVPVEVISQHDDMDEPDSLHPEIYLPEGDEISHDYDGDSSLDSHSQLSQNSGSFDKRPMDIWIKGSGHINPAFQPDELEDNSSIGSGSYGELTMDQIVRKKDKHKNNTNLNFYESMVHNNGDHVVTISSRGSGKKSVERYIFDDESHDHLDSGVGLDKNAKLLLDDDVRSDTLSRESLALDSDSDDAQSYHSNASFSTFSKKSGQSGNKSVSMITLNDWRKSVENLQADDSSPVISVGERESNTDEIKNKSKKIPGETYPGDDSFSISIVPGSVYTVDNEIQMKESRYKKKDGQNKGSRFNSDSLDYSGTKTKYSATCIDSLETNQGQINHYEPVGHFGGEVNLSESTDDLLANDARTENSGQSVSGTYGSLKTEDLYSQTEKVLHDFDQQIENLEGRKSDLGTIELSVMNNEGASSKHNDKKEKRGSLFKLSRKKSTDYASKQSSWKVLKKRIRAGLFKKSLQADSSLKPDFVWSKYSPNPFDEGMKILEESAKELFGPEEAVTILKYVKTYHEDHEVDKMVDYLLIHIDVPEKILILKDVRQVIYKFDMCNFDDLVKQFEIENYERLSTYVHRQLNHEKRRKPKKYILHPETDEFGHFYIKPSTKQKDQPDDNQRQVNPDHQPHVTLTFSSDELLLSREDKAFREKYGDDIIISHIPKQKETLGLCISGGVECKRQPQIKVDEILPGGAAADESSIQPGMIVLAIDNTDLRESTHTDAILTLKKSFNDRKSPCMVVILENLTVC